MKSYDERIESIFKKYDERLAEQKRRRSMLIRRTAVVTLGTAAALVIGIGTQVMKPPRKPEPQSSNIVVETNTDGTATTTTLLAEATTSMENVPASTSSATSTSVVTTAEAIKNPSTHTTTAAISTAKKVSTTASAPTTAKQSTVTSAIQTQKATSVCQTGVSQTIATDIPVETTTGVWKRVFYGEDKKLYSICSKENETITVAVDDIGDYYDDALMKISVLEPITGLPISNTEKTCKLYNYKDYSPIFTCVVMEEGDAVPKLYYSGAAFNTLGELIEGTHFDDRLVITEAYDGVINPENQLKAIPTTKELMNALSDTDLKSLNTSELLNRCSYSLSAEMPEIGLTGKIVLFKDQYRPQSGYISLQILGNCCTYDVGADKLDEFIKTFVD